MHQYPCDDCRAKCTEKETCCKWRKWAGECKEYSWGCDYCLADWAIRRASNDQRQQNKTNKQTHENAKKESKRILSGN